MSYIYLQIKQSCISCRLGKLQGIDTNRLGKHFLNSLKYNCNQSHSHYWCIYHHLDMAGLGIYYKLFINIKLLISYYNLSINYKYELDAIEVGTLYHKSIKYESISGHEISVRKKNSIYNFRNLCHYSQLRNCTGIDLQRYSHKCLHFGMVKFCIDYNLNFILKN